MSWTSLGAGLRPCQFPSFLFPFLVHLPSCPPNFCETLRSSASLGTEGLPGSTSHWLVILAGHRLLAVVSVTITGWWESGSSLRILRPPTPSQILPHMEVQVMMLGHVAGVSSAPHPTLPVARIDREGCPLSQPSPQRPSAWSQSSLPSAPAFAPSEDPDCGLCRSQLQSGLCHGNPSLSFPIWRMGLITCYCVVIVGTKAPAQ